MFDYDVMTEDEAQKAREFTLLPDGTYNFEVIESKLKYSNSGNAMIALTLKIIHEEKDHNVFDYLVGTKNMAWKTKHFCEATGLESQYVAKQFNEHLAAGRRGKCMVSNTPAKPKNDGTNEMYKAKNTIEDYIPANMVNPANPFAPPVAKPVTTAGMAQTPKEQFDSDLPF
jgi:hypothetical protein